MSCSCVGLVTPMYAVNSELQLQERNRVFRRVHTALPGARLATTADVALHATVGKKLPLQLLGGQGWDAQLHGLVSNAELHVKIVVHHNLFIQQG